MSGPALVVVFPFEGRPRVVLDCGDEGEERRLRDWLEAREDIAELVARALAIAAGERAA